MVSTLGEPELPPCPHCGEHHPEDVLVCPKKGGTLPLRGRLLDGKFRLLHLLGEGGMGSVWKAENVLVRKTVALKLMHGEYARNEKTLARFRNEATAAGRIGNAHICDILDFGRSSIGPYIVMELLRGRSLADLLATGPIDPGLAVLIIRQALLGLEAAHRAGIIHRDLKPENVFLHEPEPGRLMVKLMDFGISKFTEGESKTGVGVLMGTPEYMSPEQAEGAAGVDERTDIWAMGVLLYRALTGREAFLGKTLAATLLAVATKDPPRPRELLPAIDEGLERAVMRCLAKAPGERFASSRELSDALAPYERVPTQMPPMAPVGGPVDQGTTADAETEADVGTTGGGMATVERVEDRPSEAPGPDESWTMGGAEVRSRPTSTLSRGRSPLWMVFAVLVLAGAGAAVAWGPLLGTFGSGTAGVDAETGTSAGTDVSAPADVGVAAATDDEPTGAAAGPDAGPKADVAVAAATGSTGGEDRPQTGADTTGGARPPGDGGAKPPKVRVDHSKVHRVGSLYTPREGERPVTFAAARRKCARLKGQRFAGLSGWRMATGAEIARFRGKLPRTLYWTRSKTAYNMLKGTIVTTNPASAKARALCVSTRR